MKRDIVVNGRFLSRRTTGVERYGREILSHSGDRYRLETTRSNGVSGHLWEQFILPRRLDPQTILWSPANTGPLMVTRQAVTIHDLSVLEHPEWFQKRFAAWYSLFMPILIRRAQLLFTPSEYVKQKLVERFGARNIVVTPNGVDASVFHPSAQQSQYKLPRCYILFVGTLEPRKNVRALLRAWEQIQTGLKDVWLVIVGTSGRVHRSVDLHMTERVLFLGYVGEHSLPGLYTQATLFVLPSLDEGFGVPVLEAMACGVPVLTSNGGALSETVGDAGCVYDLSDPASLGDSIQRCLDDRELRSHLTEKGLVRAREFPWQKTAETIWTHLNEL